MLPTPQEEAAHVETKQQVELFGRRFIEGAHPGRPSVVDQNIERTDGGKERFVLRQVGHVRLHRLRPPTVLLDQSHNFLRRALVAHIVDEHECASFKAMARPMP